MICDVCGRDNPDTLTFCQDCGRRLKPQRVVAPTPPNGMPRVVAAPAPAAVEAAPDPSPRPRAVAPRDETRHTPPPPSGPPSQRRGARPEAPAFSFGQPAVAAVQPAPVAKGPPVEVPGSVSCPSCRAANPPDYRFCVTCGASLKRPANGAAVGETRRTDEGLSSAKPVSVPAAEPRRIEVPAGPEPRRIEAALASEPKRIEALAVSDLRPLDSTPRAEPAAPRAQVAAARPAPADDGKIVGSPVVDIASSGSVPAKLVACGRCHGNCVAGTKYCKYCGASLDETPSLRGGSAPRSPAPDAAPARSPAPPAREVPRVPSLDASRFDAVQDARYAPATPPRSPAPASPKAPPRSPVPALPPLPIVEELPEPGQRAEISALAGSPVPLEPIRTAPARAAREAARVAEARKTNGRLVVIVEDGSEGRSFSLADGQLDIGRTDGDIVLEDDHYVSPRHARLRFLDGRWILRDLDSTNHVYVRIRRSHPLNDGDLLLLGLEVLQFQTVSDGERGLGHAIQHGTLLFGSPATPRRARLCQRTVEGVVRDVYHLFRDETVIGRETGDLVFTADPFLSRRHAAIRRSPITGEFSLADLDSSNGTYVAIQGEVGLSNGDFLRIGQHLFRVDLG